jgi:hypothetical protein
MRDEKTRDFNLVSGCQPAGYEFTGDRGAFIKVRKDIKPVSQAPHRPKPKPGRRHAACAVFHHPFNRNDARPLIMHNHGQPRPAQPRHDLQQTPAPTGIPQRICSRLTDDDDNFFGSVA